MFRLKEKNQKIENTKDAQEYHEFDNPRFPFSRWFDFYIHPSLQRGPFFNFHPALLKHRKEYLQ